MLLRIFGCDFGHILLLPAVLSPFHAPIILSVPLFIPTPVLVYISGVFQVPTSPLETQTPPLSDALGWVGEMFSEGFAGSRLFDLGDLCRRPIIGLACDKLTQISGFDARGLLTVS